MDLTGEYKITLDEVLFLEDWDISVDMEEMQIFPNFRLWCKGPNKLSRPLITRVEPDADRKGEGEGDAPRRNSVLVDNAGMTHTTAAPKGWKVADDDFHE